ncbi:MAG: hypothetical protein ACK4WK_06115, partial [Anaerolineae bacterium]
EERANQRAQDVGLPIRFNLSRIEDRTDPALRTEELAEVYRQFLRIQKEVVRERFGETVLRQLLQQVISQINPSLM